MDRWGEKSQGRDPYSHKDRQFVKRKPTILKKRVKGAMQGGEALLRGEGLEIFQYKSKVKPKNAKKTYQRKRL